MINCFTHRGISLEYEVSGQGTPLVFLHGLGGSIRQIPDKDSDPTGHKQQVNVAVAELVKRPV